VHGKFDLVRQLREVLLRLSQLRFTFTLHRSLSPSVEQFMPEMNTKGAEITCQEWDTILAAVPGESVHIRKLNEFVAERNRKRCVISDTARDYAKVCAGLLHPHGVQELGTHSQPRRYRQILGMA
jgi:hypothetical protein